MTTTAVPGLESPWRSLGTTLSRNRRGMLIAFLGSSVLAGGIALVMPPSYKSEAVLLVRLGQEYLVNADPANTAAFPERREILASEAAMITAPELALRVIQDFGLQRIYPNLADDIDPTDPQSNHDAMERALQRFSKSLVALPGKESTLIDVTFKNRDPEVAGAVLTRVVNGYLDMRRKVFETASGAALSGELRATEVRLAGATDRLDAFRHGEAIADFEAQLSRLFEEKALLVKERDQAADDIPALRAQLASLTDAADQIGTEVPLTLQTSEGDDLRAIREAAARLRLKQNELGIQFKDAAPQIDDARHEYAMSQALLRTYGQAKSIIATTGRPPSYDRVQALMMETAASLVAGRARIAAASTQLAHVDEQIAHLDDNRALLHQLIREEKVAEDAYFQAGKRVTEAVAHDNMMEAAKPNVVVVQAARVPFEESWTRLIVAAAGVVVGLILAGSLAYMDDLRRSRAPSAG